MRTVWYATLALLMTAAAGLTASAQDMSMVEPTLMLGEHDVFGEYLADGDGRTLYVVVDDDGEPVDCAGECAEAWPPLLVDGAMDGESAMADDGAMAGNAVAGEGVDPSLVGTMERDDGSTQLTYNGLPLYYFVNDVEPGDVNCQGVAQFGGTWYVLYGDGEINRTAPD